MDACRGENCVTIPAALQLAADAHIVPVVLDARGAVLHLGRTRRLASPAQRLALAARDRGCSFPACDRPPDWCETHHVHSWADGGTTDLNNTTLLCGFHHREHTKRGWTVRLVHGLPEWIPPHWIDPGSTRNKSPAATAPTIYPCASRRRRFLCSAAAGLTSRPCSPTRAKRLGRFN
jgi:uncharacterized protein DUF222/HNH endonuclease